MIIIFIPLIYNLMGNCICKGLGLGVVELEMVKVVTSNGGLMELYAPITAECITNEFPGYGIFRSPHQHTSQPPLLHREELCAGQYYYLLPLHHHNITSTTTARTNSTSSINKPAVETPYRMSVDNQRMLKRMSEPAEVLPRYNSTGVWKVRLVISSDQLSEILSQEAQTEELIENVRTVAKCATGVQSAASSDHRSWANATDD